MKSMVIYEKHSYLQKHGYLRKAWLFTKAWLLTKSIVTSFRAISRHTVVCRAAQEASVPPVSILTGRKKTQFSHLCSSVIPYPIGTKFATDVPASWGSLHTKFEENRSSHFRDTSEQNFVLISSFFSTSLFRTLRKIRHTTRMRARIGLKFGTLKELIKADSRTNFGRNPMNIHGVMTDYLRKIRSKVCHAYRVNSFEESVEN